MFYSFGIIYHKNNCSYYEVVKVGKGQNIIQQWSKHAFFSSYNFNADIIPSTPNLTKVWLDRNINIASRTRLESVYNKIMMYIYLETFGVEYMWLNSMK